MKFSIKIAALLCAISLWLFVVLNQEYERSIVIPIKYQRMSPMLAPMRPFPNHLQIMMRANGFQFARRWLDPQTLILKPDLSSLKPGRQNFKLQMHMMHNTLAEIKLLRFVDGDSLILETDVRVTRKIPVRLVANLKVAEGFQWSRAPEIIPTQVEVSGARNLLAQIQSIPTNPVNMENIRGDDSSKVDLDLNALPPTASLVQKEVLIRVQSETSSQKIFAHIPVHLVGLHQQSIDSIRPQQVDLILSGNSQVLNSLHESDLRVFLESGRIQQEYGDSLTPTFVVPLGINQWECRPSHIRIFRRKP